MSSIRNGAAMILAAIGGFCFGALLARQFRALILLPVSLCAIAFISAPMLGSSQGLLWGLLEGSALSAAMQTGYFFGLFALHTVSRPQEAKLKAIWR